MFADFFPQIYLQQFGKILDVEIIFNERGSKVSAQKTFDPDCGQSFPLCFVFFL